MRIDPATPMPLEKKKNMLLNATLVLGSNPGSPFGREVKWLIDGLYGERLPANCAPC
jgi:hypothetical protein